MTTATGTRPDESLAEYIHRIYERALALRPPEATPRPKLTLIRGGAKE
jgi:hypothetical protein